MLIYIDAPPPCVVVVQFDWISISGLPEPLVMAFSLVPSCFHGYLTSSSFSTTQFFPPSLSCGVVSASPDSKLRTCAKFEKFQGDSPLEQTTSASASQEVPLEAEDPPEEEEEDDRFSKLSQLVYFVP